MVQNLFYFDGIFVETAHVWLYILAAFASLFLIHAATFVRALTSKEHFSVATSK